MLTAGVLVEARSTDVVSTEQLHCFILNEVASQAADVQVKLVELVEVKARVFIHPALNRFLLTRVSHFGQLRIFLKL